MFLVIAGVFVAVWLLLGGIVIDSMHTFDAAELRLGRDFSMTIVPAPESESTLRMLLVSRRRIGGPYAVAIDIDECRMAGVESIEITSLQAVYSDGTTEQIIGSSKLATKTIDCAKVKPGRAVMLDWELRLSHKRHTDVRFEAQCTLTFRSGVKRDVSASGESTRFQGRWQVHSFWKVLMDL